MERLKLLWGIDEKHHTKLSIPATNKSENVITF